MKQGFKILIRRFDEKIGMKSKTLLERLKQYKSSIGGSVLELSPATRQTRVRFPADAKQQSKKHFAGKAQT